MHICQIVSLKSIAHICLSCNAFMGKTMATTPSYWYGMFCGSVICLSFSWGYFCSFFVFCNADFERAFLLFKSIFHSIRRCAQNRWISLQFCAQLAYLLILQHTFSTLRTALPGAVFREWAAFGSTLPLSCFKIIGILSAALLENRETWTGLFFSQRLEFAVWPVRWFSVLPAKQNRLQGLLEAAVCVLRLLLVVKVQRRLDRQDRKFQVAVPFGAVLAEHKSLFSFDQTFIL